MRFLVSTMLLALLVSSAYSEKAPDRDIYVDGTSAQQKIASRCIALIYCPAQIANTSSHREGDNNIDPASIKTPEEAKFITVFAGGRLHKSNKKGNLGSLYTVGGNKDFSEENLLKSTYISHDEDGYLLKINLLSLSEKGEVELSSGSFPDTISSTMMEGCATYYNK